MRVSELIGNWNRAMHPDEIVVIALTALSSVAFLLVIASGLAIIFGIMRIINMAHGEFLMLGAFTVVQVERWGLSFWLGLAVAPLVVGAIGLLVERTLIRFLYGRLLEAILATWGLSLIIAQSMQNLYGPLTEGIPPPLSSVRIGDFFISQYSFVLICFAVAMLLTVYWLFMYTRYGVMARAASQLPDIAATMGVHSERINMLTFGLGAAITGLGGALIAPLVGVVPTMGAGFIAQAFMTVVTGGPLIVSGTIASGILLGTTNSLVSYFATAFLGQAALLIVAIIVLRLCPDGISSGWKGSL
jgi:branched-chain amino acid transport system permease protein